MIDVFARPIPSGLSLTDDPVTMGIFSIIQNIWNQYAAWFLLLISLLALVKLLIDGMRRQQKQVEKIWRFLLFFLSKRQMMLPLVHTLAKRDQMLDEAKLQEILVVREKCQNCSFRRSPSERMALEKNVSRILLKYFSELESKGQIHAGSKFEHLMRDLEFIDEKLVQLQKIYNQESEAWNKKMILWQKLFGFPKFEIFK